MSNGTVALQPRQPPDVDLTTTTRREPSTDLTITEFPDFGGFGDSADTTRATTTTTLSQQDRTSSDSVESTGSPDSTRTRFEPAVTTAETTDTTTTSNTVVSAVLAPSTDGTGDTLTIAAFVIAAACLLAVVLLAFKLGAPKGSHARAQVPRRGADTADSRDNWAAAAQQPATTSAQRPPPGGNGGGSATDPAAIAARQPLVASVRASAASDSGQLPGHVLRMGGSGVVFDAGASGPLHVRAASVRGASHAKKGVINQDGYLIMRRNSGTLVAIADGVSSSTRPEVAVHATLEAVARLVVDRAAAAAPNVIADIAAAVKQLLPAAGGDRGPACTVVFALIEPAGSALHVHAAGVGDSVLLCSDGQTVTTLGGGSDIPGAPTAAIPRDLRGAWQRAVALPAPGGLLLCTDGFGEAVEKIPAVRDEVATWRSAPDQWQVAATCDYRFAGYGDDRTVIGVWSDIAAPA